MHLYAYMSSRNRSKIKLWRQMTSIFNKFLFNILKKNF